MQPSGALFFSSWLTPFTTGVMIRTGEKPTLYGALSCLNRQLDIKCLFLYMAEKANHTWVEALDTSKISLGTGKRILPYTEARR